MQSELKECRSAVQIGYAIIDRQITSTLRDYLAWLDRNKQQHLGVSSNGGTAKTPQNDHF